MIQRIFLILLMSLGFHGEPQASFDVDSCKSLYATWTFSHYLFGGKKIAQRDPNLKMDFIFNAGTNALLWYDKNDSSKLFCHRKAIYQCDDNSLIQKVIWLDPKNTSDCANDPDMQVDLETTNPFLIDNNEFQLDVALSGDILTYVFKKVEPSPKNKL